jgi:hypothetical protein
MPQSSPRDYEIPGDWQLAAGSTWLVPRDFNIDHPNVNHWLFDLGDWRLYSALGPAKENSPDFFRCSAAEVVSWLNDNSVQALIESFHDDTEWVVAFGSA